MYSRMSAEEAREYADRIVDARQEARRARQARRHAFWERLTSFLLSIPAGIAVRIGG